MNILQALRNPQSWVYLLALVKVLLASLGVEIAPEQWAQAEQILNALAGLAVAFGVFAYNPFEQKGEDR